MSTARRRLDDLKAAACPARLHSGRVAAAPRSLAEVLGGLEQACGGQRYWLVDTPFDQVLPGHALAAARLGTALRVESGARGPLVVEPGRAMVLDIETGGLAAAPVFLVGVVLLDQRPLTVRQFLARDYPEEESILRAVAELAGQRDTWVTFNGKTFDEPFLRDRATLHRVRLPRPAVHVDLLHAARRAWGGRLPDCRLVTIEQHVLRRPRYGDVPGSDVPLLFHHFIQTGAAGPLRPVLEHNRLDLLACTELLLRLAGGPG